METPPVSTQALPSGTRIEEFVIERVLGSGGFGITYLATDTALGRRVVIKENLPAQFCFRDTHSLTVAPRHTTGEDADNFQWSLENFSKESAMLASLDHPGIVRVLRSFQACGTAYFVMPYVEGVALDELSKQRSGKPFSEEELRGLLERMLDALGYLHDRGIYHRDIKPGNLLITNGGLPVLIDFGSARQRLSERSMTVVESAGYTPFEQLQSRGNVGPWSDLYALGGTLVKILTGETPPKAMDRMRKDPFRGLAERADLQSRFKDSFLRMIDKALAVDEDERWQDAGEWLRALRKDADVEKPASVPVKVELPAVSEKVERQSISAETPAGKVSYQAWVIVASVVLGLVAVAKIDSKKEAVATNDTSLKEAGIQIERGSARAAGEKQDFEIAPGVKITMCWIPPGEFLMGSPAEEAGRHSDETQHRVTISKGFWLAQTETSQAQWQAVMGNNPSDFKGKDLPVETVSWNDIAGPNGFIAKVNRHSGTAGQFSLPTEAQWEYACRAGTTGAYAGDLDRIAWYVGNSDRKTHPVAGKQANAWGLHDMSGNVWEWCADWYGGYAAGSANDPRGASSGTYRVSRGGGWYDGAIYCRVAGRGSSAPTFRISYIGFRVARSSVP